MTKQGYEHWVLTAAESLILDIDPQNDIVRPSTLISEYIDVLVDQNWTDEDAFGCLMSASEPCIGLTNHDFIPDDSADKFPFKAFAAVAFHNDVMSKMRDLKFDTNHAEDVWEAAEGK